MSGWIFSSSSGASTATGPAAIQIPQSFDQLLDVITSELLPTPSLGNEQQEPSLDAEFEKTLDLSDLIRSGLIKPAEASKGFRRRLAIKNPNVQLRSLITLDTCIKNSGDAFLREIAGVNSSTTTSSYLTGTTSKSLVDELGELIRNTTNNDVKNTALRLLQNWALAFQSKPNLSISEMVLTYTRLKQEGQSFPPVSAQATSAMIDSLSAPTWIPNENSNLCSRCRDAFTLTNRRHHCRNCGQLFDQKCSSQSSTLPHFGIALPVRVCDGCYKKIKNGKGHLVNDSISKPNAFGKNARSANSKEDEDLQLALRLSLHDSQSTASGSNYQSGYLPSYEPPQQARIKRTARREEEEDPDLVAAIAASLRDMELAPSAPPPSLDVTEQSQSGSFDSSHSQSLPILPNMELSALDMDRLLTFSQTTKFRNPQTTANDLAPLYENAESSRRELVKSVKDAAGKEQILSETRDKLREIMRLYEGLLEKQVSRPLPAIQNQQYSYQSQLSSQQQYETTYIPQQTQMYPNVKPYQQQADSEPQYASYYPQTVQTQEEVPYGSYATYNNTPQFASALPTVPQYSAGQEQIYPPVSSPALLPQQHFSIPAQPDMQYQQQLDLQYQPGEADTTLGHPANLSHGEPYQPQQQYESPPPQNTSLPLQQHYAQPIRHISTSKVQQARQLQNLPHAPSVPLYSLGHFPNVPDEELPQAVYMQKRDQDAVLIEL